MQRPGQSAWVIDAAAQTVPMEVNVSSDRMFASCSNISARNPAYIQITVCRRNRP